MASSVIPSSQVARAVKVTQVDTPYFTIVAPANAYQKVAPGVALIFRIQFRPEEQQVPSPFDIHRAENELPSLPGLFP